LCALTCAPEITAPLGSATVPVIDPVTFCAIAADTNKLSAHPQTSRLKVVFMNILPWCFPVVCFFMA
jgi:hypothetical protein